MAQMNPMMDKVAIVGVGSTKYGRDLRRTSLSLGLEAATKAILDAGMDKKEIDGIVGMSGGMVLGGPGGHLSIQEGLGLGPCAYVMNAFLGAPLVHAAHAVFSGGANAVLVVQVNMRDPGMSSSARNDPFRVPRMGGYARPFGDYAMRWHHSAEPYAAWAQRYMHENNAPREVFGMISVNNRTNATKNPEAIMRTPITMDDYLNARMIRDPLGLLDMDLPADNGEALVLTSAERAKQLTKHKPVYIHALTMGQSGSGVENYENGRDWQALAPWIAFRELWKRSDIGRDDVDVFFPYDGFTTNAISFFEAAGYSERGGAYQILKDAWDEKEQRLKLNEGRTLVHTNGGGLSHGRAGGFNFYPEVVRQLRGEAGERQHPNAKVGMVGIGSFYHDAVAGIFRN